MNACGFVHSNRFTVPVTVVGAAMLYIAVEWCAKEGAAPPRSPKASANVVSFRFICRNPCLLLFAEKLAVVLIILANEFVHFGHFGPQRKVPAHRKRLGKHVRIFDARFILQR